MADLEVVPPNTARIVEGFRDTGYSFDAAIADLIDNSIEAGATEINVQLALNLDKEVLVSVADNGSGMDLNELRNAMRYGADEREDAHRLGRFGLGLKTASTSFCRRLTVLTRRPDSPDDVILAATWDLDLIAERGEWVLELGPADPEQVDEFLEALEALGDEHSHGTVVVWKKVDRLLQKKHGGEYKDLPAAMRRRQEDLKWHIRTVFQRFLSPTDSRVVNARVRLNGEALAGWDPFCEAFPEVSPVKTAQWHLKNAANGVDGEVSIRAFILPKPNETSDPKAFRLAARTAGNERQGFFVYREGRMIDKPGWLDIYGSETHLRSLRIEMNFPATLDSFFGVGLRKTGLHLDSGFVEVLNELVIPLRREANTLDRQGSARTAVEGEKGQRPSDRSIASQRSGLITAVVSESSDGEITLTNNQSDAGESFVLRKAGGESGADFRVEITDDPNPIYVDIVENIEDGVLWAPAFRSGINGDTQVRVNAGHEWFRRSYLPHRENSVFVQSIDFLLFSLAQAELNNTDPDLDDEFRQFRVEVSRNLRKLVVDLPEYDEDD